MDEKLGDTGYLCAISVLVLLNERVTPAIPGVEFSSLWREESMLKKLENRRVLGLGLGELECVLDAGARRPTADLHAQ